MKKSKLNLEKFRVAKLNNLKSVTGGGTTNNPGDGTKDTFTNPIKCKDMSDNVITD